MEFTFTLTFQLHTSDVDALIERLAAACEDALVGVGQSGRFSIEFVRQAGSGDDAVETAIADVYRAVPEAKLIGATSDVVVSTDVAE